MHKTEVEDDHDYKETKEVVQKQEEGNKENEVPKKLLYIPSSDDDSTQVISHFMMWLCKI